MESDLEVLFAPAEFAALSDRDLSATVCVVFDVLRATSSIVTALGNGASALLPVAEISEAFACRQNDPGVLLAGERDGLRITKELTGTVDFDFGNSPREFTTQKVRGRKIVITTTNGTRALRACSGAQEILVCSFLNLGATAEFLRSQKPTKLLLVCSGTFEEVALEDLLGAGALLELLSSFFGSYRVADSAVIALSLNEFAKPDFSTSLSASRNARRLLSRPELRDDVPFCIQRDIFPLVAAMDTRGWVTSRCLA